jgi:hypothetical protein
MDSDEFHYILQLGAVIGMVTLACITVILAGSYIIKDAFGAQYKPNLTGEEWQEYKLTEMCYNMEGSKMTVELLDKFCDERYGSIENLYGDKITK